MITFDHRSYSSFKHKWGYHFYIKHCCAHTIRVALAQLIRVKLPLDVLSPQEGWTNLGFCRWWLHVGVEDVDAQCWCRSFGAIHWSELHFQYLHELVPQGTNKDIHRHRVMHTQDDVHESVRLPCPLSYQQEGLWLLELVQDVEVVCTCPRQNDMSEVCFFKVNEWSM